MQCVEEKAYLWSTMTQEWLSSLTIVHNDKTDSLVLTALANDFIQGVRLLVNVKVSYFVCFLWSLLK